MYETYRVLFVFVGSVGVPGGGASDRQAAGTGGRARESCSHNTSETQIEKAAVHSQELGLWDWCIGCPPSLPDH